jgi:hypothetical protein
MARWAPIIFVVTADGPIIAPAIKTEGKVFQQARNRTRARRWRAGVSAVDAIVPDYGLQYTQLIAPHPRDVRTQNPTPTVSRRASALPATRHHPRAVRPFYEERPGGPRLR